MPRTPRNLIVLSDGTGNSASTPFKTNVWRLYQALDLRDGKQVAVFGDGVGTSSVKVMRVIGLALGIGVKRNVLNLYKFLCRNYRKEDHIWMFGFSRGAFTVRVLAGLIKSQGLVRFGTESELQQNAIAAYRAYRAEAFKTAISWIFWVPLGRYLRDKLIDLWRDMTGGTRYSEVEKWHVPIHFIGVWDTVAAYGLPVDELTIAVDKWVWPMKFTDRKLLDNVTYARQALGLDDERRTFHPIPWSEKNEKELQLKQQQLEDQGKEREYFPDRLLQVWFPGMHADVGGGYPDDGLSLVPLCWMIDEAADKGLTFEPIIVKTYRATASPTGRLYDSRSGTGAFWRYQPRDVRLLMSRKNDYDYDITEDSAIKPLVHCSAITRMTYGNDGYAPISLPLEVDILLPDRSRVLFDMTAVGIAAGQNQDDLKTATDQTRPALEHTATVLNDMTALMHRSDEWKRSDYFELVRDTVWWRRCVYFLTLALALVALAFPLLYEYLVTSDKPEKVNQIASGALSYVAGLLKGVLPGFTTPWVDAVTRNGPAAIAIVLAFLLSLALSTFLQRRISDRSRGAWNVQSDMGGGQINRLRLTGQRRALAVMTFLLFGATLATLSASQTRPVWLAIFGLAAVACAIIWRYRVKHPEDDVKPSKPRWALWLSRSLRKNKPLIGGYRWVAQTGGPALFMIAIACLALSGLNLGLFNLQSTAGKFCNAQVDYPPATRRMIDEGRYEKLGAQVVDIRSLCAPTGMWLIAGRNYRIKIEPQDTWFDRTTPADVGGFGIGGGGWAHLFAAPLKRWWRENYFQPIARVGNIGNYEYPLTPAAPLPKVNFKGCREASWRPTKEGVEKQLECEKKNNIVRNKVLISDITPNSTGELYVYVNDVIVAIPGLHSIFYDNNIGTAKVTVTRTEAPATIDFKP